MPNIFSGGMAGVSNYLESNYGYAGGTKPLRQSMLGSDDIQMFPTAEAQIQARIAVWQNMLADTDPRTTPKKIKLIKAKLAELSSQLASVQAGLGSAGAMEALQADRMHQTDLMDRGAQDSWSKQQGYYAGEMGFGGYDYSQPYMPENTAPFSSLPHMESGYKEFGRPDAAYQSPAALNAPAWMAPYLSGGQVRPLGMQDQLGALDQAALWEQGAMQGVSSIEQYMEREPYIQAFGDEQRARSMALAPKTYSRRAQWEKALQR